MVLARWGLVPFFTKDLKDIKGLSTINARAESITTARTWREPFKKRRCIIPADAFYEWEKAGKPPKQPYVFDLADGKPLGSRACGTLGRTRMGMKMPAANSRVSAERAAKRNEPYAVTNRRSGRNGRTARCRTARSRSYASLATMGHDPFRSRGRVDCAWNSHDLSRVLAFYTEEFEMSSPHIANIMGERSGMLYGKPAIRGYSEKAMVLFPGLHFTLETVYTGANSLVICYTNQAGRRCGEILFLNNEGKCFRSAAHHA